MALNVDLEAWRHTPYGGPTGKDDIVWFGVDWSAETFTMSFSDDYGDTTVNKSITNAAADSEGISASYDADMVNPVTGVPGATIIRPQLNETTMENTTTFPNPTNAADDRVLKYDLQVGTGTSKRVIMFGKFTIKAGVGT